MIFLSPGVKTREVDYSTYVGQTSTCIVGMVGAACKGPLETATLVTSPSDFVEQFGEPLSSDYAGLAALEFLKQGNQLYFLRVAESTVAYASVTLANGLITVRAKEKGTYYEKFSAAITAVSGTHLTITIYMNDTAEEVLEVSTDPTSDDFLENADSYWVDLIYNDSAVTTQPYITSFDSDTFVNDTENKWSIIKDSKASEITTLVFNTNVAVGTSILKWSADSTGKGVAGTSIGTTSVSGNKFTITLPAGTLNFVATWVKEFKIVLTTAAGLSSEEVIKVTSVASGASTVVTAGSGDGPTTVVTDDVTITLSDAAVYLAGGNNGAPLTAVTVIGSGNTGLQAFRNTDEIDINLLAAPGFYQATVVNQLLEIAEARVDTLAIIDPPQGLTRTQVIAYHNGTLVGDDYPTKPLNSSYGAIYYPWVQINDIYSGNDVWVPPSGVVLGAMAYNDNEGQPWFAPAGLNRGMLSSVLAVETPLDEGSRDALYGNGNAINSIVNYKKQGITIWGQRTLQRKTSATDRINVRRLMNLVRKAIAATSAYTVFEQNDELTWRQWTGTITPYLESIQQSRGLYAFKVQMDATTVSDYYINRGEMPANIWLQPTKTAEFIPISFILTSTGASFTS